MRLRYFSMILLLLLVYIFMSKELTRETANIRNSVSMLILLDKFYNDTIQTSFFQNRLVSDWYNKRVLSVPEILFIKLDRVLDQKSTYRKRSVKILKNLLRSFQNTR
jgi:hypothetical protein